MGCTSELKLIPCVSTIASVLTPDREKLERCSVGETFAALTIVFCMEVLRYETTRELKKNYANG